MQEVELVEDDGSSDDARADVPPCDPSAADDDPARPGGWRRWSRRRRVVAAALVVLVAGSVVAVETAGAARERARLAVLAAHPGVAPRLDGPPETLWTASSRLLDVDVRTPQGLLVGIEQDDLTGDGQADLGTPVTVWAVDATTGATAWRVEVLDPPDLTPPDGLSMHTDWSRCVAHPGDGSLVVCLAHDAFSVYDEETSTRTPASTRRLVVLDTADGSVVSDLSDVADAAETLTVVGDLLVLGSATGDQVTVTALTTDAAVSWTRTLTSGTSGDRLRVEALDDVVVVTTSDAVVLLDAAGEELRRRDLPEGTSAWVMPDGVYVILRHVGEEGGDGLIFPLERRSVLLTADGEQHLDGYPFAALDDGSVPGLVLSVDDELHARGPDGREQWSRETAGADNGVVLDGRVHMVDGTDVLTLDARTGAELWRHPVGSGVSLLTDGRRVLVVDTASTDGSEIAALDRGDGSVVWRGPLPAGTQWVQAYLGLLVAYDYWDGEGHQEIMVLG